MPRNKHQLSRSEKCSHIWPATGNPVTVTHREIWSPTEQRSWSQLGPALQHGVLRRSLFIVDLEAKVELLSGDFFLPTQQCNTAPTVSAPTRKLKRAVLREKCARTHLSHQMNNLLGGFGVSCTGPGLTLLHGQEKADRDSVMGACRELQSGMYLPKGSVWSPETGSLAGGGGAVSMPSSLKQAPCKVNHP